MRRAACLLILALLPGAYSVAEAQSMAELAAKEKEKRKTQKTGKVYDEYELKKSGQGIPAYVPASATTPTAAASPAATASATTGAKEKEKTPDELQAEAAKAWREKLQKATEEVQRLTQLSDSLQKSLGDMSGNMYGAQRTNLLNALEKTKADLGAAQKQVEDLQEEGRRSRYR